MMIVFLIAYTLLTVFFIFHNPSRAFTLRRIYVRLTNFILGFRIIKDGQVLDSAALYVCNHRTLTDPLITSKYLDSFVIAKAEVANMPILHSGAKLTGVIYVKRGDQKSRNKTRAVLVSTLLDGANVLVFPEGTTNKEKHVLPFKAGTFHEAHANNIPVVPIALEYKNKESLWFGIGLVRQFFRQLGRPVTEIKISFGPALTADDGNALRDKAQKWVNDKIDEMHEGWGSHFDQVESVKN